MPKNNFLIITSVSTTSTKMTSSERFCLKWNDFQQNTATSYQDLRQELEFSDVTLVCEDDQQIEAHKIILSASSPFFKTVLKRNKHSHPMLYMKGFKGKDLAALVDFIYLGEANIYQEDLDTFLTLAGELQLKGLADSQNDINHTDGKSIKEELLKLDIARGNSIRPKQKEAKNLRNYIKYGEESKENSYELVSADEGTSLMNSSKEDLSGQINSMMEKITGGNYKWKCTVCGKMTKQKQDISRHIETHIEGASYPCNLCGVVKRSSNALNLHTSRYHKL